MRNILTFANTNLGYSRIYFYKIANSILFRNFFSKENSLYFTNSKNYDTKTSNYCNANCLTV